MPVKLKDFTRNLTRIFADKKKAVILLIVGVLGMVLIGLSDTFTSRKNSIKSENQFETSIEEYIDIIEKKTTKIISDIDGAGKCRVMITAKSSEEKDYVYNQNITEEISGTEEKHSEIQTEIVITENNGQDGPIVIKINEPEIRGVLVLCEGADDLLIKENITQAVKTVLGISSNKICVLKLK